MTRQTDKPEVEIIQGEVTAAYEPTKNEAGKWRPANIYVETDDGSAKIAQFPKSDFDTGVTFEPIQMPPWYTSLDIDNLVGSKVQVVAAYKSIYEGTKEYNRVQTFKVLDGVAKVQADSTPGVTSSPAAWGSLDERIAWNSALNNSCSAIPWKENYVVGMGVGNTEWLNQVDTLAQDIYALIRRGPLPPVEDTPDADQPDDNPEESLGVLSAEGDNAN